MTLVVCFLSFHYVLVYLLNFHYVLVYLLNYEFVDVWFLSQLYLKLGPGFNSILVPPLLMLNTLPFLFLPPHAHRSGIEALDQSALWTKGELRVVSAADPEKLRRRLHKATG